MRCAWCLFLALTASGAASQVPLGLDYSEWGPLSIGSRPAIAADSSGAVYLLLNCPGNFQSSDCVTKLSADGKTVLWQNSLGFAGQMAVDPDGGVYVASATGLAEVFVEKLTADGSGVLWTMQLSGTHTPGLPNTGVGISLAVDATGRVFVACGTADGGEVARLNASGGIDFALPVPIAPSAIAVDPTGTQVVVAVAGGLARLAPDGISWLDISLPQPLPPVYVSLAVAANGDAAVYGQGTDGSWVLQRVDAAGDVLFSTSVPGSGGPAGGTSVVWEEMGLDAAGNAYITGFGGATLRPVRNSVAPCGSGWLSAIAPDGTVLQTTYLPGAGIVASGVSNYVTGLVAVSASGAVIVLASSDGSAAATQAGPFPEYPFDSTYGAAELFHLSPHSNAQLSPLACVGNSAGYAIGAVAPGELVTLFGSGLGPAQGVQTQATPLAPYPAEAAGVEVTFDGTPAPLLWVQDSQINAVVPWSVSGTSAQVCVTYGPAPTNCLNWPVAEAAPGVFTADGVHALAVNQDGTPNGPSNPAPLDSTVTIFATGLGPISPAPADGSLIGTPAPANTMSIQLQCTVATIPTCPVPSIVYGGMKAVPVPLGVAGLSEITFRAGYAVIGDGLIPLMVAVETPSGTVLSNAFQISVSGSQSADVGIASDLRGAK